MLGALMMKAPQKIAVVGAGLSGATCAHALSLAGHDVHVFEKSRGPGGRLATRRLEWTDAAGQSCVTRLDHGAIAITATSAAFQSFAEQAVCAGWMADWAPALAYGHLPLAHGDRLYLPVPDLPALCRQMLLGIQTRWNVAVDGLARDACGWTVAAGGVPQGPRYDAVLLAVPPAQASPLLSPHRADWARHASVAPMQPCWTLMGIADASDVALGWDLARPPTGPLAWVMRNDARPGRQRVPGEAHWVLHARPGWSRRHLDASPQWVQGQLQSALRELLGRSVIWRHSAVHRWRYAVPRVQRSPPADSCWWDSAQALGVCGDFLGGCGAEGAWLSAQALAASVLQRATDRAADFKVDRPHDLTRHERPQLVPG
jgi:predicted NAD/FAD-dependent oxidoreductase